MLFTLAIIKFSSDPLINIAGAYFPAWLVCIIVGLVGTGLMALFFDRLDLSAILHPPLLMIPGLFAAITLWTWIFLFAAR